MGPSTGLKPLAWAKHEAPVAVWVLAASKECGPKARKRRATTLEKETDIVIRSLTGEDRAALLAMYEEFEPKGAADGLPPAHHPEVWLDRVANGPNLIALVQDRIVGHAILCPEGASGELAVFVHQGFRNRGIGRRLLAALIQEADRMGLERVWGTTEPDNIAMIRLTGEMGFQPSERERNIFWTRTHSSSKS